MSERHCLIMKSILIHLLCMKKIAVLFLLSIFLFNTIGYFVVFTTLSFQLKNQINYKITNGVKAEELTLITIDKKHAQDIEWLEMNEEMHYKGERYDIIKSTETAETITYYCISDKQEEHLFASLYEHIINSISGNDSKKNTTSKKVIDDTFSSYFSANELLSAWTSIIGSDYSDYITEFTSSTYLQIDSPPPEVC